MCNAGETYCVDKILSNCFHNSVIVLPSFSLSWTVRSLIFLIRSWIDSPHRLMRWRRWRQRLRLITNLLRPMKCINWLLLAGNASRCCEFQFRQSPMIYNIMARVWLTRAYSRDYSRVHAAWCVCGIDYMRTVTRLRSQGTTSIPKVHTVFSAPGPWRCNVVVVCTRICLEWLIICSEMIPSMRYEIEYLSKRKSRTHAEKKISQCS